MKTMIENFTYADIEHSVQIKELLYKLCRNYKSGIDDMYATEQRVVNMLRGYDCQYIGSSMYGTIVRADILAPNKVTVATLTHVNEVAIVSLAYLIISQTKNNRDLTRRLAAAVAHTNLFGRIDGESLRVLATAMTLGEAV